MLAILQVPFLTISIFKHKGIHLELHLIPKMQEGTYEEFMKAIRDPRTLIADEMSDIGSRLEGTFITDGTLTVQYIYNSILARRKG